METKTLKLQEDVSDVIAQQELFGWSVKSKQKTREMTGVEEYENFTKVVFERDEQGAHYAEYVRLEKEYAAADEAIDKAKLECDEWEKQKPTNKPVWKTTKSVTSGGYTVEWDKYYGDYKPLHWIVYAGCFSPFLPIMLIIIIVNGSKKKKCQKKLAEDAAAWEAKYKEWEEKTKKLYNEYTLAINSLETIISNLNALKD